MVVICLNYHYFVELTYIIEGSGYQSINGTLHRMEPGTISFLPFVSEQRAGMRQRNFVAVSECHTDGRAGYVRYRGRVRKVMSSFR